MLTFGQLHVSRAIDVPKVDTSDDHKMDFDLPDSSLHIASSLPDHITQIASSLPNRGLNIASSLPNCCPQIASSLPDNSSQIALSPPDHSPLIALSQMNQSLMGRRHSVDSNIEGSRQPTFVRTFREAKWKRVNTPSKLVQDSYSPNGQFLGTSGHADAGDTDSREYISGTHIIRQRVPIFRRSSEPSSLTGRRFSAGDLIPVTGSHLQLAHNGKCLVIGDTLPSRLSFSSVNDDSSSSTHCSTSLDDEDDLSDLYEFSLIDEDDEDGDVTEDGSDEDDEEDVREPTLLSMSTASRSNSDVSNGNASLSSSDELNVYMSALVQNKGTYKHNDLRRLALENSIQKTALVTQTSSLSNVETALTSMPEVVISSTSDQVIVRTTSQRNLLSLTANPDTSSVGITSKSSLLYDRVQPYIDSTITDTTLIPAAIQSLALSTQTRPAVGQTNPHPNVETSVTAHIPLIWESALSKTEASKSCMNRSSESTPSTCPPDLQTPDPGKTSFVMRSSRITDADVHVSSYQQHNSKITHWITPRVVDGIIPIDIEDAKAIHIDLVAVRYRSEDTPLIFQRVTYSSGYIYCSARWVAPTSFTTQSLSSSTIRTQRSRGILVTELHPSASPAHGHSTSSSSSVTSTPNKPTTNRGLENTDVIQRQCVGISELAHSTIATTLATSLKTKCVAEIMAKVDDVCNQEDKCSPSLSVLAAENTHHSQHLEDHSTYVMESRRNTSHPKVNSPSILESCRNTSSTKENFPSVLEFFRNTSPHKENYPSVLESHRSTSHPTENYPPVLESGRSTSDRKQNSPSVLESSKYTSPHEENSLTVVTTKDIGNQLTRRVINRKMSSYSTSSSLSEQNHIDVMPTYTSTEQVPVSISRNQHGIYAPHDDSQSLRDSVSMGKTTNTLQSHIDECPRRHCLERLGTEASCAPNTLLCTCPSSNTQSKSIRECKSYGRSKVEPQTSPRSRQALTLHLPDVSSNFQSQEDFLPLKDSHNNHWDLDVGREVSPVSTSQGLIQLLLRSISDSEEKTRKEDHTCESSAVAIDNKIEQAMDLVKRHLMYAVREEVEILKQQIGEMVDRIGQLEYENTVLRSEARPETLNKLQQPRSTQTSQISVPSSNVSTVTSPNLQQPAPQSSQQQLPQQPTS